MSYNLRKSNLWSHVIKSWRIWWILNSTKWRSEIKSMRNIWNVFCMAKAFVNVSLHAIGNILVQHSLHIRTMTIHYNCQWANFLPSFDGPSERDAMLINSKDNAEWLRSNKMDVVKLCFIAYQMESIQNRHFAIRWYGICRYHTSLSPKCARVCVWTIRHSHTRNGTSQWIPKMVKRKMIIFASS